LEEQDLVLTILEVSVLVEIPYDQKCESCSVILTVEVGLVAVVEVASQVPIVLMMSHVSARMRVYLLPRLMQLGGTLVGVSLRSAAGRPPKRTGPQGI
jgi:hypothetical protein